MREVGASGPVRHLGAASIFATLCAAAVFLKILPVDPRPGPWPAPDLTLCLALAWAIRRPDLLPIWVAAPVLFLADMLLMRPPGLSTALVLIVVELLRRRHRTMRTMALPAEVAMIAGLVLGLAVAQWLILALTLAPQPPLAAQLRQVPVTLLAYLPIAALCHYGLGLRKRPAQDGYGQRVGL